MTDATAAARVRLGDALMDPDVTEDQVNAAQEALLAAIRGQKPQPALIRTREERVCTMVRAEDGEFCAIPDVSHWPHQTTSGDVFPPPAPGFDGRILRVT